MKKLKVLVLVIVLAFGALATMAFVERESWTGEPDPMACNFFEDCYWTTPVCIEGATYEVGIFYDPAEATPEEIAASAVQWSGTVLTAGACELPEAEPVVRNLWAYINPTATEGSKNICYILSLTQPTQSAEDNDVARLCFTDMPAWANGATLLVHGDVYDNGTDFGFWEGDGAAAAFSNAKRLPLYADGPNNDLLDVANLLPWTQK